MSENQEPKKKGRKDDDSDEEFPLTGGSIDEESDVLKPVPSAEIKRLRDQANSPTGPNFPSKPPSPENINKGSDQKKN